MQTTKPCYDTAEQNPLTRFETETQVYALPYSYLLCALLSPNPRDGTGETLTLLYVSHTVTIRGDRLSSLLLVFQKGRSQGDIAKLSAEDIDWADGSLSYFRAKTGRAAHVRLEGEDLKRILRALPGEGPLFP